MENFLGLLKIKVLRGFNLAKRDFFSSDPYVIVRMGKQKVKTRAVKRNVNPVWNEELTLSISDPNVPIKIQVYDKDTFTPDDKMGDAEFDIKAFAESLKMNLQNVPSGTIITKVKPTRRNCIAEESSIIWENGKLIQHMFLRLRNVECGEIELQLNWTAVNKVFERKRSCAVKSPFSTLQGYLQLSSGSPSPRIHGAEEDAI